MALRNASLEDQWLLLMRRMRHPRIAGAEDDHTVGRVLHVALLQHRRSWLSVTARKFEQA